MKKILIQNGFLCDGTGREPEKGDLLLFGDTIEEIAPKIDCPDAEKTDASGLLVTPGFIAALEGLQPTGFGNPAPVHAAEFLYASSPEERWQVPGISTAAAAALVRFMASSSASSMTNCILLSMVR